LIGCRQETELVGVARGFDAPGVDDDVLRGRRERHDDRKAAEEREPGLQADGRERQQTRGDKQLADDHPAAPTAEAPEDGGVHAIDHWRPEEFDRVGQPDPRQEPDGLKGRTLVAQPVAQSVAGQQEGQT
jgi:hypothetical protein